MGDWNLGSFKQSGFDESQGLLLRLLATMPRIHEIKILKICSCKTKVHKNVKLWRAMFVMCLVSLNGI